MAWRNFRGLITNKYASEGQRFFVIKFDKDQLGMIPASWPIQQRTLDGVSTFYMKVHVNFHIDARGTDAPVIYFTNRVGNTIQLGEATCGALDGINFDTCDLVVREFQWTVNGREGVSAFLTELHIVEGE